MCHLEYYVYSNCAHKQQHSRPRPISNFRLGLKFSGRNNEAGWVPCLDVQGLTPKRISIADCKARNGGRWPVQEKQDPERSPNCMICNRSGEENDHNITIRAGVIVAASAIQDRVHQINPRYAGNPGFPAGMCSACSGPAHLVENNHHITVYGGIIIAARAIIPGPPHRISSRYAGPPGNPGGRMCQPCTDATNYIPPPPPHEPHPKEPKTGATGPSNEVPKTWGTHFAR